jgi:dihydroorotate dehydrogenase electron transfer subunit
MTDRVRVDEQAAVISNSQVASGFWCARVLAPRIAAAGQPGQFVQLRLNAGREPFLRLPLSLGGVDADAGWVEVIYQVRGAKTTVLAALTPGSALSCLGPLGRGFSVPPASTPVVLVGGGIGVPPLLFLGQRLRQLGHQPQLLVGARGRAFHLPAARLQAAAATVLLATDDGSLGHHGLVTALLAERLTQVPGATVCACGPEAMLAAVARLCEHRQVACQVSLEAYMACGIGVCMGCAVAMRVAPDRDPYDRYQRVCVDGPVFDSAAVDWGQS